MLIKTFWMRLNSVVKCLSTALKIEVPDPIFTSTIAMQAKDLTSQSLLSAYVLSLFWPTMKKFCQNFGAMKKRKFKIVKSKLAVVIHAFRRNVGISKRDG